MYPAGMEYHYFPYINIWKPSKHPNIATLNQMYPILSRTQNTINYSYKKQITPKPPSLTTGNITGTPKYYFYKAKNRVSYPGSAFSLTGEDGADFFREWTLSMIWDRFYIGQTRSGWQFYVAFGRK